MAKANNVRRKQGDTYPIEVQIFNSDGQTAYSLAGVTEVKMGVAESSALLVTDTPELVLVGAVTDSATGMVEFSLTPTDAAIPVGVYNAEIQMIDGAYIITTDTFKYEVAGQIVH